MAVRAEALVVVRIPKFTSQSRGLYMVYYTCQPTARLARRVVFYINASGLTPAASIISIVFMLTPCLCFAFRYPRRGRCFLIQLGHSIYLLTQGRPIVGAPADISKYTVQVL